MVESGSSVAPYLDVRLRVLTVVAAAAFTVLAGRLFQLQMVRGAELSRRAEMNRTQMVPIEAPRGFIRDRNGELLADSVPSFSIVYSAQNVPLEHDASVADELIRYFPEQRKNVFRRVREARRTGRIIRVVQRVPRETAFALMERRLTLPGVNLLAEPERRARFGMLASHVIGYVDEVSPGELKRFPDRYKMGQLIGKTGVERMYDDVLQGAEGGLQYETDAVGHFIRLLQSVPSRSGSDIVLTVDRRLQEAVEAGLDAQPFPRGAAVALDPRTGAVLALASRPGFDPSESRTTYLRNADKPLFNRAIQGAYPPGSLFKAVTAAAGLRGGDWNVYRAIYCDGAFELGNWKFGCWKVHHLQNYFGAMAWSCNVYFYNLGLHAGPDAIEEIARGLGLGRKVGIDLPFEVAGLLPGRQWKRRMQGAGWFDGDTLNFSIGQGATLVTPLQMASMFATIANGGTLWKPFVLSEAVDPGGRVIYRQEPTPADSFDMQARVWERVRQGLYQVSESGTGRGLRRPDLAIGSKTGTAQNPHGESHAWFAAFAGKRGEPATIAIAVVVENGGHGATSAMLVVREALNAFFPLESADEGTVPLG